jgi:hypothetical protein
MYSTWFQTKITTYDLEYSNLHVQIMYFVPKCKPHFGMEENITSVMDIMDCNLCHMKNCHKNASVPNQSKHATEPTQHEH